MYPYAWHSISRDETRKTKCVLSIRLLDSASSLMRRSASLSLSLSLCFSFSPFDSLFARARCAVSLCARGRPALSVVSLPSLSQLSFEYGCWLRRADSWTTTTTRRSFSSLISEEKFYFTALVCARIHDVSVCVFVQVKRAQMVTLMRQQKEEEERRRAEQGL